MLTEAKKALDNKDYAEAIRLYSLVIEAEPKNELAYQGLADALYKSNKLAEARNYCEMAIKLNPNLPSIYVTLCYVNYKLGNKAEECYQLAEKAYTLAPNMTETLACFGFACLLLNKNEQSIKLLQEALNIDSSEWDVRNNLSIAYSRLNRFEEANDEILAMYRLKPSIQIGIKLILAYGSLKKVKTVTRVVLFGCILFSLIFNSTVLLIVPAIYAALILLSGIYALSRNLLRIGIVTILSGLILYFVIFFIWFSINK